MEEGPTGLPSTGWGPVEGTKDSNSENKQREQREGGTRVGHGTNRLREGLRERDRDRN